MKIARSGRFVFVAQWVAVIVLPGFFFIGRGLLGAEIGWMGVLGIVYGIPVVLLLLVPPLVALFDRDVRQARATRFAYDVSTFAMWSGFFIGGITMPDGGDVGPLDTALTVWTSGGVSYESSSAVFAVTLWAIGLSYLAAVASSVVGIVYSRRTAVA
ncbi:hypothetical protein ACWPKO_28945 (plasmid) [Coraliomargarita sp. W4R53]